MRHDVLGGKAPTFVPAPCWVRYGIIVYVYTVSGELCAGVVLCDSKRKHTRSRRTTRVQRLDHMSLKCHALFALFPRN